MSVRSELEVRLAAFAAAQSPAIPVSYQSVPFTKPASSPFMECFIVSASTITTTVDARRQRERGNFQVNLWWPSGVGAGKVEALAKSLALAFPVIPKQGTVSIEDSANVRNLILDQAGWIIAPVSIPYRAES